MPHVIVKLWPGPSEQQKARLAASIHGPNPVPPSTIALPPR
jgi:hypothetical protein